MFATTVTMSTYLLAWVVSDFKSLSNADGPFNSWAHEDVVASMALCQEVRGEYARPCPALRFLLNTLLEIRF